MDDRDEEKRRLAAVGAALVRKGVLQPVARRADDGRYWLDCELASCAENRLGEVRDPQELTDRTRDRWMTTALFREHGTLPPPWKRSWTRCYWVMRSGRRAGTIAIATYCWGDCVRIESVYLRPHFRGRGIMVEVLRAVQAELGALGLGLLFTTGWTWQHAIRFYLRAGFWLSHWKRDLEFVHHPHGPPPVIRVHDKDATVAVDLEGRSTVLARARREGSRLVHHGAEPALPDHHRKLSMDARTTLALAIAVEGWPLIRRDPYRERRQWSDSVHPEALAERIRVWEAWAHERGWRVDTPRIPDLDYATWAELEAEFA